VKSDKSLFSQTESIKTSQNFYNCQGHLTFYSNLQGSFRKCYYSAKLCFLFRPYRHIFALEINKHKPDFDKLCTTAGSCRRILILHIRLCFLHSTFCGNW